MNIKNSYHSAIGSTGNPPISWYVGGKNREFQNYEFRGMGLGQVFQYLKPFKVFNWNLIIN